MIGGGGELFLLNPTASLIQCIKPSQKEKGDPCTQHCQMTPLKYGWFREQRLSYLKDCSRFKLNSVEAVLQSTIEKFPVPVLPVLNGLRCRHDDCNHLCVSTKRMRNHWTSFHGRSGKVSSCT